MGKWSRGVPTGPHGSVEGVTPSATTVVGSRLQYFRSVPIRFATFRFLALLRPTSLSSSVAFARVPLVCILPCRSLSRSSVALARVLPFLSLAFFRSARFHSSVSFALAFFRCVRSRSAHMYVTLSFNVLCMMYVCMLGF